MDRSARAAQLAALVTGRRYRLLTITATGIAVASAAQRLQELPPSESFASSMQLFVAELMSSRISAMIVLHCFVMAMYHLFLLLAHVAVGKLRPLELQQTKETLIPFVLLRCQLLVSTLEPSAEGRRMEIGLLVVWLTSLAVLRALLALTQARFQHLVTRPLTQLRDLHSLGVILSGIVILNIGLAATWSRLGLFSDRIVHVPWFEASLMMLKTVELGVQVGYQSLDVRAAYLSEEDEAHSPENSEFHLLLLQTMLCGCYLVQLVLYYLYVISVDQFRVSLFDLILILNVKNATMRLLDKVKRVKLYHQVVLDLDHLFPDATSDELKSVADDVCAICLKSMSTSAKKLHCGHLFHQLCLRQCLQRASVSDVLTGMDPLTRMANGLSLERPEVAVAIGTSSSTSLRCPICRKQVCGGKGNEPDSLSRDETHSNRRDTGTRELQGNLSNQDAVQPHPVVGPGAVAPVEVLRFSTAFLSRWVPFPNFSFEIVRHRNSERNFEVTQDMLQRIWEVFPQYTRDEICADLMRTRSVERTMERILNGHLDEQRLAMGLNNNDDPDMDASGLLGDAMIDLGEDFRWSLSTLASAMWGTNQPSQTLASVASDLPANARPRGEFTPEVNINASAEGGNQPIAHNNSVSFTTRD
ncbi:zinc finger partial [Plasmopara halstedii]|uniref:Zinc finger partial n=1 Tax=Plasmopara halstedii TaxID=4781 RepID=A0A0P1A973_PLAHL|nr:zinc finger partial [Plasmopara halstedii]CEG37256.1 zinc finger partial [Plasmopara halstedii]